MNCIQTLPPHFIMASLSTVCFIIWAFTLFGVNGFSDDRIVGGRPAEEGELPYQVSLRRSFNDKHFCGGSVISPRHILTAAHCMFYIWGGLLPSFVVSVVAGQNKLELGSTSIFRNASKLHVHENFNNQMKSNDIAIVEVDIPLPFETERISIAAMNTNSPKVGTQCIVSGWGVTEFGSQVVSEELLAANVSIISFEKCKELYAKADVELSPGMMCAGVPDGTKDACQGDSGGPLFCNYMLTGIVSTAIGCADAEYPGIYTDISQYMPWIANILQRQNSPWIYRF